MALGAKDVLHKPYMLKDIGSMVATFDPGDNEK